MAVPTLPQTQENAGEHIALGVPAPDFALTASTGDRIRISDYRGHKNVVVYFMRAFSCMQCRTFARRLASAAGQLEAQGTQVVIVGPGTKADAEKLSREIDPDKRVVILHDGSGAVYDAYALDKVLFSLIQKSALFVVDKGGVLRFARVTANPNSWLTGQWIAQLASEVATL
jgi:peroxiredoxin